MRHREESDPIVDFASTIKSIGYNKNMFLTFGEITGVAPFKVRLDGNGLETTNLTVLPHLLPAYHRAHIIFDDELGSRNATIMIDNGLELGERVALIYDGEGNKVKGFILGKED